MADDVLTFTVDVTNVGKVAGKEAVMLYSSDLVASLTPDVIRLRDFEKVALEPGESRTVTFAVPASDLAFVGHDGCWRLEEGEFRMRCGSETASDQLHANQSLGYTQYPVSTIRCNIERPSSLHGTVFSCLLPELCVVDPACCRLGNGNSLWGIRIISDYFCRNRSFLAANSYFCTNNRN